MASSNSSRPKTALAASRRSTLALHGASVALAPARSVTSHVRRVYRTRYVGRYRFSWLVFGFDLFLCGVMSALILVDLFLLFGMTTPSDGGLALTFTAAPLTAADEVPISLQLRSADGMTHEDVRLQWRVPDWVEIVRAEPPLARDGSIVFGRVSPGMTQQSLVVAHVRGRVGAKVPFDVAVSQNGTFGFRQTVTGREVRAVVSSAVSVQMPVSITHVTPGASIPLLITNHGAQAIDSLAFRIVDGPGTVAGASSVFLGSLVASSTRVIFVDVPKTITDSTVLGWQLEDQARIILASSTQLIVDQGFPLRVSLPPVRFSDMVTGVSVPYTVESDAANGSLLLVVHHFDGSTILRLLEAPREHPSATAFFDLQNITSSTRWSVTPLFELADGGWAVGVGSAARVSNSIPFSAEARYFSVSGDQIGVGPLMPQIGQSTRYWIVWSVDPGIQGLKDVVLSGMLPQDARATGQFASTVSGHFAARGRSVTWTAPLIAPSAGQGPVTFAFEAEIQPTAAAPEGYYPFIATSTIEALDAKTGAALYAEAPGDDSRWLLDIKALNLAKKSQ